MVDKSIVSIVLIGIVVVLLLGALTEDKYNLFSSVSDNSVYRSAPSTVSPGQTFSVTYTAVSSGSWGVSIIDELSGGCKFPDGSNELKTVMLNSDGNTKTIQITAPTSGSCLFSGDYKFGTDSVKVMEDDTTTISTSSTNVTCSSGQTKCEGTTYFSCSSNNWVSQGLVNGKCGYTSSTGEQEEETSTFDLNKVLFKIGDFEVTILIFLIAVIIIIFLLNIGRRK
jgi:hypothetical protein